MTELGRFHVVKRVSATVEVEVTVEDVLRQASSEALRAECAARGIQIKPPKTSGQKHKIEANDIADMLLAFRRRDWREFFYALEWALPRDFRGLSDFLGREL